MTIRDQQNSPGRGAVRAVVAKVCVGILAVSLFASAYAAEKAAPPYYSPEQVRELCFKLSSNDDAVRWKAAEKLIEAREQATEMLCMILQGEWMEGRKLAAYILGEVRDPAAVLPLASCLGDEDFHVRWKSAVSLRNIGGPAVEALGQVLQTGNLHAQHAAAWALGEVADAAATRVLAQAATSDDADLRWKAVISLKKIGEPATEELKRLLQEQNPEARRCAVWTLDQLGGDDTVEPLMRAAADADAEVRHRAAEALAKFKTPAARAVLEKLATDDSNDVRRRAVMSMALQEGRVKPVEHGDQPAADPFGEHVPRWRVHEVVYQPEQPPAEPSQATMQVQFIAPGQETRTISGFYAGRNTWKARIAPESVGEWFYKTEFSVNGRTSVVHGIFFCEESDLPGVLITAGEPRPHLQSRGKRAVLIEAPLPDGVLPMEFAAWKPLLDACFKHGFNLLRIDLPRLFYQARVVGRDEVQLALLLEQILEHGQSCGVYFVLTLFDEAQLRETDFWRRSPYNAANGGPLADADRFPMFYDPVSPELARMQESWIRSIASRAAVWPNVIFELCRNYNSGGSAVPFAKSWLQQRLAVLVEFGRPVMVSAADDAERLGELEGISIAGSAAQTAGAGALAADSRGPRPTDGGRVSAQLMECPATPRDAVAAAWLLEIGSDSFPSWTRTPVTSLDESVRFVAAAEERASILRTFASEESFLSLRADSTIILSAPPGIVAAAAVEGRRFVISLAGSAAGGETVRIGAPSGEYTVQWLDQRSGLRGQPQVGQQDGGFIDLSCPRFAGGIIAEIVVP